MSLPVAMGIFAVSSYLIAFIAAMCLPNATGVELSDDMGQVSEAPGANSKLRTAE
jgi:hypothetical protein